MTVPVGINVQSFPSWALHEVKSLGLDPEKRLVLGDYSQERLGIIDVQDRFGLSFFLVK